MTPEQAQNMSRFALDRISLPKALWESVEIVYSLDLNHYRSIAADKYGRKLSHRAKNAELLMVLYFRPRVEKGKKWHMCGYAYLAEFMGWEEKEVKEALAFLKRKGLATVAKAQYSVTGEDGVHRSQPALWELNPNLIKTELRTIGEAVEGSLMFEYADGRVVHVPLSDVPDLQQPIFVGKKCTSLESLVRDEQRRHSNNKQLEEDWDGFFIDLEEGTLSS